MSDQHTAPLFDALYKGHERISGKLVLACRTAKAVRNDEYIHVSSSRHIMIVLSRSSAPVAIIRLYGCAANAMTVSVGFYLISCELGLCQAIKADLYALPVSVRSLSSVRPKCKLHSYRFPIRSTLAVFPFPLHPYLPFLFPY